MKTRCVYAGFQGCISNHLNVTNLFWNGSQLCDSVSSTRVNTAPDGYLGKTREAFDDLLATAHSTPGRMQRIRESVLALRGSMSVCITIFFKYL